MPRPDFTAACASTGFDSSPTCLTAVVAAVDRARSFEGVRPLVLPSHFAELPVPAQLFVAIDAERVDRGLAPFVGMTAGLDAVAATGAERSNDPPDPGRAYLLVDGEWAGGSANGLDAVYGFMYDDGYGSGNLDCGSPRAVGCWGHRHGILDDFGTGSALVMGAAALAHGDTTAGDRGGTSMAATLAVAATPPHQFVYTWAQALADLPRGSPRRVRPVSANGPGGRLTWAADRGTRPDRRHPRPRSRRSAGRRCPGPAAAAGTVSWCARAWCCRGRRGR